MEATEHLTPGVHLHHYRIETILGSGAMGTVYLAHDETLNRKVAVKVLSPSLCDVEGFLERFHREAEAVACLRHPNILQIYYIGEEAGHHFFAMEFVDGESLAEMLQKKPVLDLERAISILEQVAQGLMSAHEAGIVHRDIKPSNIMMDASGRATITDFGIAKMDVEDKEGSIDSASSSRQERAIKASGVSGITMAGEVMGTPEYMAPEQAGGQPVDQRADIYALGTMAYELLTGRLPFRAQSFYQLLSIKSKSEPPPMWDSLEITDVQRRLETVVFRAMDPNPQTRYQGCREWLKALLQIRQMIERQEEMQARRELTVQLTSAALTKEESKSPLIPRAWIRVGLVVLTSVAVFGMLVLLWKGLSSSIGGFSIPSTTLTSNDLGKTKSLQGKVIHLEQYGEELWVELGHAGGRNWIVMDANLYDDISLEKEDEILVSGRVERDLDPNIGGFILRVQDSGSLRMVQVRLRKNPETLELATRKEGGSVVSFNSLKNFPGKWRKVGGDVAGFVEEHGPDGLWLEVSDGMGVGGIWIPGPVADRLPFSIKEGDYVEAIGIASGGRHDYDGCLSVWSVEDIYVE